MDKNKVLKIEDIACYFPYGLKILRMDKKTILKAKGIIQPDTLIFDEDNETYGLIRHPFSIPILRPLSDLYKEIIHSGEKITPLVELAKIAFPNYNDWIFRQDYAVSIVTQELYFNYYRHIGFVAKDDDDYIYYVPSQYQLFDKLNELKIDYKGLIDAEVAIDVNTLEINPYEQ